MSEKKKSPLEYFIFFFVFNIIATILAIYLANYIFVQWQKIPMEYFSYKTIYL